MSSALLGALAVAFVGVAVALRSETGQQDRDPRFCRVVAWLIGGYLALGGMAMALPGDMVARSGRGAAAIVLVMALVAWTVGTRHVAVRTRLRLALIACAAIVLVHELPWPWPADVGGAGERAPPRGVGAGGGGWGGGVGAGGGAGGGVGAALRCVLRVVVVGVVVAPVVLLL
jgi:hypothetical protein